MAGGDETLDCVNELQEAGLQVETDLEVVTGGFCRSGGAGGRASLFTLFLLGLGFRRRGSSK